MHSRKSGAFDLEPFLKLERFGQRKPSQEFTSKAVADRLEGYVQSFSGRRPNLKAVSIK